MFGSVCRIGKDRKSAATWEWGYLQISLWDYWSVLFRGWCKYFTSGSVCIIFAANSLTDICAPQIDDDPNLIPDTQGGTFNFDLASHMQTKEFNFWDLWFKRLLEYSNITPRHSSISPPTWYRRIYFASRQNESSPLKDWLTPASARGVFFFLSSFFNVIFLTAFLRFKNGGPYWDPVSIRPVTLGGNPVFSARASKTPLK